MNKFDFFGPNLSKNWFFVWNPENKCWNKNQHPRDTMCTKFQIKRTNLTFLGPNLPKNGFWSQNFKNLSVDSESTLPRYHVSHFSVKMDNFEFFGLNLGKLPNYVQYFGSNIVESVPESWVEVYGAGWRLKWAGWRWVEVDGTGWRWMHGLVIPVLISSIRVLKFIFTEHIEIDLTNRTGIDQFFKNKYRTMA